MSNEIYQIAWLLVNRISTRIPAMKAKEFGELLWWINYYSDSDEYLARKLKYLRNSTHRTSAVIIQAS